jgi:uncharacterized damage-inducible protein DinB
MSEVHRMAKQLQRTFQGRAFHGPAVEEALAGVTAKAAASRSSGTAHSIWQIVEHITVWQDAVRRWLQGDPRRPADAEDWPVIQDTSEAAWQDTLRRARKANDELRDVVMALDESRLDEPMLEGMPKVYVALYGIVQHNTYHAGQISLLKKLHG